MRSLHRGSASEQRVTTGTTSGNDLATVQVIECRRFITGAASVPGVFAAGNLGHAAGTADVAALSGRHAARQIRTVLARRRAAVAAGRVQVVPQVPMQWISPNIGTAAATRALRAPDD
jgi:hypothetical protein